MLFSQYGGEKGVQEISGLINLLNPIGIISCIIFFIGVWLPIKNKIINKVLKILGVFGILLSEILPGQFPGRGAGADLWQAGSGAVQHPAGS